MVLFNYLGAYYLNKLFKKQIVGAAPSFRVNKAKTYRPKFSLGLTTTIIIIAVIATAFNPVRSFISDNIKDTKSKIETIVKSFS